MRMQNWQKLMQSVIGELVKRYVTMNLRRDNDEGVTEDDVTIRRDVTTRESPRMTLPR